MEVVSTLVPLLVVRRIGDVFSSLSPKAYKNFRLRLTKTVLRLRIYV